MPLTVTTWNVENFSSNSAHFVAKREHLVTTLQDINPDIVVLQEILSDQTLFKFQNSWASTWGDNGFGYFSYDYVKTHSWRSWGAMRP
jgi:exonuclease III